MGEGNWPIKVGSWWGEEMTKRISEMNDIELIDAMEMAGYQVAKTYETFLLKDLEASRMEAQLFLELINSGRKIGEAEKALRIDQRYLSTHECSISSQKEYKEAQNYYDTLKKTANIKCATIARGIEE
jgi:hypothetical protein